MVFISSLTSKQRKPYPVCDTYRQRNEQVIIDALNSGADLYFEKRDAPKDLFYELSEN
jgi:hypothetical protein